MKLIILGKAIKILQWSLWYDQYYKNHYDIVIYLHCEIKYFPPFSVNKGCHSHLWLQSQPMERWWALRELRILAPESWGYQRNDFREPRLLHLPIHREVWKSLTWGIWFSFTYQLSFDIQTTCLCCKTSV